MLAAKVVITLDLELLSQLDQLVAQEVFPNRSKAIQEALQDKLARLERSRLTRESAKLDPKAERAMAEESAWDLAEWPE